MAAVKPKAYSYLRFSTPEQMKGDSFRRQVSMAEEYAARHGLDLDAELTFRDLGVSAFRGRNAEAGRLGDFLQAVDDGLVPPGSFLLVESLDRISRQAARKAFRVLEGIVERGVVVVTLNDGRAYDGNALDRDPMALLLALLTFIRANEESETKARRLAEAWKGKRAKMIAQGQPLTSRAVAWVERDPPPGGGRFRLIPERAEIVRRIFAMTLAGVGQHAIAQTLNREGVPTWGKAEMWHRSYIAKILRNPAAMGTMVPHVTTIHSPSGRRIRKPLVDQVMPGYYPAAVDPETFQAVQAMNTEAGRKAPGTDPRFILASLAKCPVCGGSMTRKSPGKVGRPMLVCVKAKAGAGCNYVSVPVEPVETALLAALPALRANVPAGEEGLDRALENAEANLDAIQDEIDNVLWAIRRATDLSPALMTTLRMLEGQKEAAEAEVQKLSQRAATATAAASARRIEAAERAAAAEPRDPAKINAALRQAFRGVVVDYRTGFLHCQWRHGGESEVLFALPKDVGVC